MNIVETKYHLKRIFTMLRYRGSSYTFNYVLNLALYNSNIISEKILYPLFPQSVFYPRAIEIETTTQCNLRCVMCEHTYWKERTQKINYKQFKYVLDQFPKLTWIGMTGIGTSFLNPDYIKFVRLVKSRKIYLELYDHFNIFGSEIAKEVIKAGVDRVIISLDGATKKTYEKIRVNGNFDKVIQNIEGFYALKKKMKAYYPEITYHFIISKDNLGEILDYIDLVHRLSQGENTSIYFTSILHPFAEIKQIVVQVPESIVRKAELKAKELGIKIAWNRNVPKEKESIEKCNEWTMPYIFVDGTVVPCCAGLEANTREYQKKTGMGNIYKTPFKEIWKSPQYQALRQMIHDGKTPAACKHCTIYKI